MSFGDGASFDIAGVLSECAWRARDKWTGHVDHKSQRACETTV